MRRTIAVLQQCFDVARIVMVGSFVSSSIFLVVCILDA
jgi:hypothetical protein